MHELAYDLMKTDIVLPLIPGPRHTSGFFSPDEDREKRNRSKTIPSIAVTVSAGV